MAPDRRISAICNFFLYLLIFISKCEANDIMGCGGFVKSHVTLDFSKIEIGLYTKEGSLKERTECAPTNGYYFLPLYEKGDYVLKVHPPAGWSFEPSQVELNIDGILDQCSTGQDVNFSFNGFGITGKVITAGQTQGPSGITVQLINEKGDTRTTTTAVGGDFHFTPVIPGKYTVKASHSKWKLEPAQAVVQVKEGNTALPIGSLTVKGYDVKGSVYSNGYPVAGLHVLLYSLEDKQKLRVEGCNTALLQGVPDSPICHSVTDGSGEFTFGLVPAGEYKILALNKSPGQAILSYNVKPETVKFSVLHDSLYIDKAFEVTGFTVTGTVTATASGPAISGVRVSLDGKPVGNTDTAGKYTLSALQSGVYTVSFEHEYCEFEPIKVSISAAGAVTVPAARAERWRVCGHVTGGGARRLRVAGPTTATVAADSDGKWCTYLAPGVYTANVEVTEQELRDGLQYYPLSQKVSVSSAPVEGVSFSQLKARLSGAVRCEPASLCRALPVALRPLAPHGGYAGSAITTTAVDGAYTFSDVLPGSVEVSVPTDRLCWAEARHNVAVTTATATVPAFQHTGFALRLHSSHDIEVEFTSATDSGTLKVEAGASQHCVRSAAQYQLTPRGCHQFQPPQATADTAGDRMETIYFIAVSHAVVLKVTSAEKVSDLVLRVSVNGGAAQDFGPITPQREGSEYLYTHTLYMAENEKALVTPVSSSLLFSPAAPSVVVGSARCQPAGLELRARRGLTLAGRIQPAVSGAVVTLTSDDLTLTQVTKEDGRYSFGPLDPAKQYSITSEKESYVLSAPDKDGTIRAHKLAEIIVHLRDDADGTKLQGALVSVSGGSYRRNLVSGPDGTLRFNSLAPGQYYAKPLMKEYRFTPPHTLLEVQEGGVHTQTLRGVRVAWSCMGSLSSLSGAGWAHAVLQARPHAAAAAHCATEEATTEPSGHFRIRGLLPGCVYSLQLKESNSAELAGLKLVKTPPALEVKESKDITGVRLIAIRPQQITDVSVLVQTPAVDHYRTLKLRLALEDSPTAPVYVVKLDAAGFSATLNPGLMYVLPRLPADNKTYMLTLESSLSKTTHSYQETTHYFTSDGKFKSFTIKFLPKVKSSEQELRQTSLLVVPLLAALAFAFLYREKLLEQALAVGSDVISRAAARPTKVAKPDILDKASIEQIVNSVNAAGKKVPRKKVHLNN